MEGCAILVISFLIWPVITMWRAYAVSILWGWFVFPATHIATPTIYLVAGTMLTLNLILPYHKHPKEEGDATVNFFANIFGYGLALPALALGAGWIWKWLQWGVV